MATAWRQVPVLHPALSCSPRRSLKSWLPRQSVELARIETSPEDLRGMIASTGILTARGGVSSHAALVARQWVRYAWPVLATLKSTTPRKRSSQWCDLEGRRSDQHQWLDREVFNCLIKTADSELKQVLVNKTMKPADSKVFQYYNSLMKLADKYRKLGIRTNADQPDQVANAGRVRCRRYRAMPHRAHVLRRRSHHRCSQDDLAEKEEDRKAALAELLPYQQKDFEGIFRALDGQPACIRLLTHRCTSSCLTATTRRAKKKSPNNSAATVKDVQRLWITARVQPNARFPRMSTG